MLYIFFTRSSIWPFHRFSEEAQRLVGYCQANAQKIAEFLASHPRVKQVNYAGLPDHPGRALHYSQVYLYFPCCLSALHSRMGSLREI